MDEWDEDFNSHIEWKSHYHKNGVPERYCKKNGIDKQSKELVNSGIEWIKNPKSIVLSGGAGTGKTQYMYCLMVSMHGRKVEFYKSKQLDDFLLDQFNEYGTTREAINELIQVDILLIDDFGVDRGTDRSLREYYNIIDGRWENMKTTVISTNMDHTKISEHYGDRILSRLKDYEWLMFDGPDLRGT